MGPGQRTLSQHTGLMVQRVKSEWSGFQKQYFKLYILPNLAHVGTKKWNLYIPRTLSTIGLCYHSKTVLDQLSSLKDIAKHMIEGTVFTVKKTLDVQCTSWRCRVRNCKLGSFRVKKFIGAGSFTHVVERPILDNHSVLEHRHQLVLNTVQTLKHSYFITILAHYHCWNA
jgi:hypothetical protein